MYDGQDLRLSKAQAGVRAETTARRIPVWNRKVHNYIRLLQSYHMPFASMRHDATMEHATTLDQYKA